MKRIFILSLILSNTMNVFASELNISSVVLRFESSTSASPVIDVENIPINFLRETDSTLGQIQITSKVETAQINLSDVQSNMSVKLVISKVDNTDLSFSDEILVRYSVQSFINCESMGTVFSSSLEGISIFEKGKAIKFGDEYGVPALYLIF